jgi:hypothetical protein
VRIWEAAGARRSLAAATTTTTTPQLVRLLTRLASDGTLVYHIAGASHTHMRACALLVSVARALLLTRWRVRS